MALRVQNLTRSATLVENGKRADNFATRFLGLQGKRSLPVGGGLMIEPCNSIHMLFMRFPIDALYVDRQNRVLRICHNLRPWRLGPLVRHSRYVLELPAGVAAQTGTQVGDQLRVGW